MKYLILALCSTIIINVAFAAKWGKVVDLNEVSHEPNIPNVRKPPLFNVPLTLGMRSGLSILKKGDELGWHSTEGNEETLVILQGSGIRLIKSETGEVDEVAFQAPALLYVPIHSNHNIIGTSDELLKYIYVVAPTPKDSGDASDHDSANDHHDH